MQELNEVGQTVNIDSPCGCRNYWIEERILPKPEYTKRLRSAKQTRGMRTHVSRTSIKNSNWKTSTTTGVEGRRYVELLFSHGDIRSSAIYRHDGSFEVGSPLYEELVRMLAERHADEMNTQTALGEMLREFDL
jgi:hypothetical protein